MSFSVRSINLDCLAIDDASGKTVAFVTPQGYVDWLLREPAQDGVHLEEIDKETHLGNVRGLKFTLYFPGEAGDAGCTPIMEGIDIQVTDQGRKVVVSARSASVGGGTQGEYRAELGVDASTGRYLWTLETRFINVGSAPLALPGLEYNNLLPAATGGRFLCERLKKFDRFLIVDKDGAVWDFPHQHVLHYGLVCKPGQENMIGHLVGAPGGMGGYFGESFNPVITIDACDGEPCWMICDGFYDFHCWTRHAAPLQPGKAWAWRYRIHWLDATQSKPLMERARRKPVSEANWKLHSGARLGLGFNDFRNPVRLDGADEGSAFVPDGIERIWDRSGGPEGNGMLKMVSSKDGELVWSAATSSQIPPGGHLRISGKMRVEGNGRLCFRLRPHCFHWRPEPHADWMPVVQCEPVGDTAGRWVAFSVPEIAARPQDRDTELLIELAMEGPGTGALSCVNVELD